MPVEAEEEVVAVPGLLFFSETLLTGRTVDVDFAVWDCDSGEGEREGSL